MPNSFERSYFSCPPPYSCGDIYLYRFWFNGKENDKEGMGGGGSTYDFGFRIYNSRLVRFLSIDPLTKEYPMLTPYQFAENMPIWAIDIDGLESAKATIKYVVRIYDASITGDGHIPAPEGTSVPFTAGNGSEIYTAGTTLVQEGDPEGNIEIRFTDVVPGSHAVTYWVIEKPKPLIVKIDVSKSSKAAQVPPAPTPPTPPIPPTPPSLSHKKNPPKKIEPSKRSTSAILGNVNTHSQSKTETDAAIWTYKDLRINPNNIFEGRMKEILGDISSNGGKINSFTIKVFGPGDFVSDGIIKNYLKDRYPGAEVNFNYHQPQQRGGGAIKHPDFAIDVNYENPSK